MSKSVCVDFGNLCRLDLINEMGVSVSEEPLHAMLADGFVEQVQIPESPLERAAEELVRHECPYAVEDPEYAFPRWEFCRDNVFNGQLVEKARISVAMRG